MLLEDGVGPGAVGADGPDGLDEGPTALVVLPARVGDGAVVQRVRQVIAVLANAQAADAAAVGLHHVEVAARLVLVVFVALERGAAAFGDEDDVAVGGVGGVQVAPLAARELAEVAPVDADFKDVNRLLAAAQLVAAVRSSQPWAVRRSGRGRSQRRSGRRPSANPCRGRGPGRARD